MNGWYYAKWAAKNFFVEPDKTMHHPAPTANLPPLLRGSAVFIESRVPFCNNILNKPY